MSPAGDTAPPAVDTPPPAVDKPPSTVDTPPLEKPRPDPAPLENWPIAIRFNAAAWSELIAVGWGSAGFSGGLGVRYHAVSLDAEVHGDPSLGARTYVVGNVSFWRISGDLLLCAHWGWFAGCGLGQAGRFVFPDRLPPMPASTFEGALGVRMGLDFPMLAPKLFLHTGIDLLAPIHPTAYNATGTTTTIFETAGPSVGIGLGLLAELPL